MGAIANFVGLVGAFVMSMILSKNKKYKLCVFLACIGSTTMMGGFILSLLTGSTYLVTLVSTFLSFSIVSTMAVGLEFACEVTYPVPANNASGVMLSYSQFLASLFIVASGLILTSPEDEKDVELYARKLESAAMCVILMAVLGIGMACATFSKQNLIKTQVDIDNDDLDLPTA